LFWVKIQGLFGSGYGFLGFLGSAQFIMVNPLGLIFKNYLNTCNLNFGAIDEYYFDFFSVLMFESDSCILQFLNKLNLTYRRLTGFVMSFYFVSIVLVPWNKFSLCHTPIRPISAFQDQMSILIVGCVTTWSRGSHQLVSEPNLDHIIRLNRITKTLI
jgi:hypothetical protein